MICSRCGKPSGTLKDEIAELHDQGLTAPQIRDKLVSQGWGRDKDPKYQLQQVHHVLNLALGLKSHKKTRVV